MNETPCLHSDIGFSDNTATGYWCSLTGVIFHFNLIGDSPSLLAPPIPGTYPGTCSGELSKMKQLLRSNVVIGKNGWDDW